MLLRKAIFDDAGKDKDITAGIAPSFMCYDRNSIDLGIKFAARLSKSELEWAFDITKEHMEELYDSSGYGWDDEDKERELAEDGARFLVVRDNIGADNGMGDLVAFAHFRFTVQGKI